MLVKPTVKGQIVIPAPLRKKYGITEETQIHVYEENGRIILEPITREYIRRVRGMLKGIPLMEAIREMRAEDQEILANKEG